MTFLGSLETAASERFFSPGISGRGIRRQMDRIDKPTISPARWVAYRVLHDWALGMGFAEDLLAREWRLSDLKKEDLHLSQELVYGVLRRLRLLDFWIDRLAAKGIGSLPQGLVECLRLALYQLAFLDKVPSHAAVNEAVVLAKRLGFERMSGVVNGVLRQFPRRRPELDRGLRAHPNSLAISSSHPNWLVEWAFERWGEEKANAWLRQNNRLPGIYLQPLLSRLFPEEDLPDRPDSEKAAAQLVLDRMGAGEYVEELHSIRLPGGVTPTELQPFREGLVSVQDPSARQAVLALDPKPGERIYDLCSAPGGKTCQIADRTREKGVVISVDRHPERIEKVRDNLQRCGFRTVQVFCHDLLQPWPEGWEPADGVLVDVPCSGLGTLRRRVDLRYRITRADVEELARNSERMLERASSLVRLGGRLVYSTCTLTREENQDVVAGFLKAHPGEWVLKKESLFPDWLEAGILPERIPDCDGAFVARLARTK